MIPTNLDECIQACYQIATDEDLEDIRARPEEDMIEFHHTIGRWMRNEWGLWTGGPLKDYFLNLGLWHPDDMSSLILKSFCRYVKSYPLKIEEQVEFYKRYWSKLNV